MFYRQLKPKYTKSNIKIKITDFSQGINTIKCDASLPVYYARNSYNFSYNTGNLKRGLGFEKLSVNAYNIQKSWRLPAGTTQFLRAWEYVRYDKVLKKYQSQIIVYCDNGVLYYSLLDGMSTTFISLGVSFDTPPNCLTYRTDLGDCFYAFGRDKIMRFNGSDMPDVFVDNVPSITSIALHAGRLFATSAGDENILYFSDDLNPVNWNVSRFEGGYIELADERGKLKKVIECNNYLYVIREFGITRVSGWGLQDDFDVKNLYLSTSQIYHNSAVLSGHVIMLLCKDGVYYFNGSEVTKMNLGLDKYFENVDNSSAIGAFLNGKYYLACRLNFDDDKKVGCEKGEYINNALLQIDLSTGDYDVLRGVDIVSMRALLWNNDSKLMVCFNDDNCVELGQLNMSGQIFGVSTQKYWESPMTDLGYPQYKKAIKVLHLYTKSDVSVIFKTEAREYVYNINGSLKNQTIPINLSLDKFSFVIETNEVNCDIGNPILEVAIS